MDNNDLVGLEKVDELSKLIDLEIGDVDPSIYFERGLEYKNLGDHEKAIDDYTNAINKNPALIKNIHFHFVFCLKTTIIP